MSDDPVADLLRGAKLNDAQRAGLWDLYHSAKNEDDLAARLKMLQLSDDIKADLWDLKAKKTEPRKPLTFPTKVTIGMGPQLVPPVGEEGAPESRMTRTVEALSGIGEDSPEALARLIGTTSVLPGTGRAATAAAGAVAGKVIPFAMRQSLKAMGVPLWMLEGAGALASAARRAMSETGEAAPVAEATLPKAAEAMEPSLDLTRRLRAEWQVKTGATKLPAPPQPVTQAAETAARTKYTAEEMAAGMKLMAGGKTAKEAEQIILAARELRLKWGLPTDANVADVVRKANESGRMTR